MTLQSAISSMSLGRAHSHAFPHKLDMATKYSIHGLELFYEDLEHHAISLHGVSTPATRFLAGNHIAALCATRGISVISMQPFYHYEGLKDREKHAQKIEDGKEWLRLARALGADLILVPSNFLSKEELCGDFEVHIRDLIELADLGLSQVPPIRFCYESLAWGTYVDTWERCWSVVQAVNRANFGICLDAFNIAARVWADPSSPTGKTKRADEALGATLQRLTATIDPAKVFLIQIADAERLTEPLSKGHPLHDENQPARMSWSRNCRLFYGEEGSYLPVKEISKAFVHGLGYRGWVSAELFNRRMGDKDVNVPEELASRANRAWMVFQKDLGLDWSSEQPIKAGYHLTSRVDEVLSA